MLIKTGSTSRMVTMYAYDVTTGLPYVTAAFGDAGISLWYRRGTAGAIVAITPATQTIAGAWSSGGFILAQAANNAYRLDVPDAAFAAGVDEVEIGGVATAWKLIPRTVQLTGFDPRTDAVATVAGSLDVNAKQWAGTAVGTPHTAGYPVVTIKDGTGTGEIDTNAGAVARVTLADTLTTYTGNTPQTGDSYARIGAAGAGLSAVPWNAAWDAEVQSEAADALTAYGASTYAGGDTAGTTTLLSRITALLQTKAEADTAHGLLATAAKLLSYFQSALRSDVTVDPDIGGTYDDAAHSQQALAAASAPSAAAIADAIADELLAGHVIAGSAGAAWAAAGAAADPLTNTVPGAYLPNTAGYVLGLITAGRISVTFTGPVLSAGSMEIVPGDDYHETEGVDAVWTWTDAVASYTTATATFYAEREGSTDFSKALYSIVKSGSTVTAKMRLTAAESVLLTSGAPWRFQIRVSWGTTPARSTTKLSGLLGIVDRVGT